MLEKYFKNTRLMCGVGFGMGLMIGGGLGALVGYLSGEFTVVAGTIVGATLGGTSIGFSSFLASYLANCCDFTSYINIENALIKANADLERGINEQNRLRGEFDIFNTFLNGDEGKCQQVQNDLTELYKKQDLIAQQSALIINKTNSDETRQIQFNQWKEQKSQEQQIRANYLKADSSDSDSFDATFIGEQKKKLNEGTDGSSALPRSFSLT